ncbi:hypothetical protein J6590_037429 [Homalodisca vitripennis]|nr:hypothetical protein J6590_037429 [Homalodisca vitripennis]
MAEDSKGHKRKIRFTWRREGRGSIIACRTTRALVLYLRGTPSIKRHHQVSRCGELSHPLRESSHCERR